MSKQQGVTLIELMIALSIAAILLGIAIPSFRQTISNNRMASIANEFIGGINYIRSEAIKMGRSVTMCKSSDGSTCATANTVFWEDGWIAFVDLDADGALDSGETILRTWPALTSSYTLRSTALPDFLRYDPQGVSSGNGTFAVCHDSAEAEAKVLIITRLRPRMGISGETISSCESP